MTTNREKSSVGDGDGLVSTVASGVRARHHYRGGARDRYRGAPLISQSMFSRSARAGRPLLLDTFALLTPSHARTQSLSPEPHLTEFSIDNDPVERRMASTCVSSWQAELKPDAPAIMQQELLSEIGEEVSLSSDVYASESLTPVTHCDQPSLSYTWTDSYLDETPSMTKARWIHQRTFGPVVQSEGGCSSVVSCAPWDQQEAESVWGGLHARNAAAREGAVQAVGNQRLREGTSTWQESRNRRGVPHRRFDLTATPIVCDTRDDMADNQLALQAMTSHAIPTPIKSSGNTKLRNPSTPSSDASTVIATVPRPRRGVLTTDTKKVDRLFPQVPSLDATHIINSSRNAEADVPSSQTAGTPVHGEWLYQEADYISAALQTLRLTKSLNALGNNDRSRASAPSSLSPSHRDWNAAPQRITHLQQSDDNLRLPRCGPPRGRVLRSIYED